MNVIGVIPARYKASRFEGKLLADLSGKPVIQHVWQKAKESKLLDDLMIACDDERILRAAKGFGAKAVLTSPDHVSGSDRIAEAVKDLDVRVVINIQGDEPLLAHSIIDDLARMMLDNPDVSVGTVVKKITAVEEIQNPNVVKVVIDKNQFALYFSRTAIPYNRENIDPKDIVYFKHLGIYAYRKEFLVRFKNLPVSLLEKTEKLEQLRILEAGYRIKTVETDVETIGIDTKEDLKRVEAKYRRA